jgi:hypothetical protein
MTVVAKTVGRDGKAVGDGDKDGAGGLDGNGRVSIDFDLPSDGDEEDGV